MLEAPPPAVVRARRRAWFLAAAAVALLVSDLAAGSRRAQREEVEFRDALVTSATVRREYRGGRDVPLLYEHPLTDQTIDVRTHVWRASLLPRGQTEVEIEVARLNPRRVILRGDRYPPSRNLPRTGALVLLSLAFLLARELHLRWARRCLMDRGTATPMLAVIASPPWFRRQYRLHLFDLDAVPGARARASVPLVSSGGLRVGGPAFGVWLFGSPGPLRRVAATSGEVALWPARRALLRSRATRPVDVDEATPPLEDFPPEGLRPDPSERTRDLAAVAVLAASIVAVVSVLMVTARGERASTRFADQATTVMAQVTGGRNDTLRVVVLEGDRRGTHLAVPVKTVVAYRRGVTYPVDVVWDEEPRARMAMEGYDGRAPRSVTATLALVASIPAATGLARRARARQRARRSGWMRTWATPVPAGFTGVALGYGPVPGEVTLTTRLPRALTSLQFPAEVFLSGDADPGGRVVIATPDGTMVSARSRPARPGADVRVRRAAIWQVLLAMAMTADREPLGSGLGQPETPPPDEAAMLPLLERARAAGVRRIAVAGGLGIASVILAAAGAMAREPRLLLVPVLFGFALLGGVTLIRNANRGKALLATRWWVARPGGLTIGWASQRQHLALYLPETAFLPEVTLLTVLFEHREPDSDEEEPAPPEPESADLLHENLLHDDLLHDDLLHDDLLHDDLDDVESPPVTDTDDDLLPNCWVIHDDAGKFALAAALDGSWVALSRRPRLASTARAMLAAVHLPERVSGGQWSPLRKVALATSVLAVVIGVGFVTVQRERATRGRCPEPSGASGAPVSVDPAQLRLPVRPPDTENRVVEGEPRDFDQADGKVLRGTGLVEGGVIRAWRTYEVDQLGRSLTRASIYQFASPEAARRYHVTTTVGICRARPYRSVPAGGIPGAHAMAMGRNDLYVAFVRGDLRVAVDSASSPVGTGAQQRVLDAARSLDAQLAGATAADGTVGPGSVSQAG